MFLCLCVCCLLCSNFFLFPYCFCSRVFTKFLLRLQNMCIFVLTVFNSEPNMLSSIGFDTLIYSKMPSSCHLKPRMSVASYVSLFLLVTAFMPAQSVPLNCFDARCPELLASITFETNIYLTCYAQGIVTALMPRL